MIAGAANRPSGEATSASVELLPLYARREPSILREYHPGLIYTRHELEITSIVLYRDEQATMEAGYFSSVATNRPTRASKRVTFNCFLWRLIWLEDLKCESIPDAHFHRRDYLRRMDTRFMAAMA